jgi:hypothetical protein
MNILDFVPLVRKYTRGKSEDIGAEAWLAVCEGLILTMPIREFHYLVM